MKNNVPRENPAIKKPGKNIPSKKNVKDAK